MQNKNTFLILLGITILALFAVLTVQNRNGVTDQSEEEHSPTEIIPQEPSPTEEEEAEEEHPCPNFQGSPTELQQGWQRLIKTDQCFSIDYPEDWVVTETNGRTSLRHKDHVGITSYSAETSFAIIGISSASYDKGKELGWHTELPEEPSLGMHICHEFSFNLRPLMECLYFTNSDRVISVGYGMHPSRREEPQIIEIFDTLYIE